MPKRYLSIWLPYLAADRQEKRNPGLKATPVVFCAPAHGRMMVRAVNSCASQEGIKQGMVLADVRSICPQVQDFLYDAVALERLLQSLAEWCLRFTPLAAVDAPEGLLLDISGCAHLWGGESAYLKALVSRMAKGGYTVRAGIADTIGAAWAVARYGKDSVIVEPGRQRAALQLLPPVALRLEAETVQRMYKLGFHSIAQFIDIPVPALRRRFGTQLLQRLNQALGRTGEAFEPVHLLPPYLERLPCPEPICRASGIEMALTKLLKRLCVRLTREGKGLRKTDFTCYRVDGRVQQISIGTSRATRNPEHVFKLFEHKISSIGPGLGIELFSLEASQVEDLREVQDVLWDTRPDPGKLAELLDTLAGRVGEQAIRRYMPQASHWPERSFFATGSLQEQPRVPWPTGKQRPLHMLARPEPVEIMAPLPDYPPVLFRHKQKVYKLVKADGPERIMKEWWLEAGEARDYYQVEDEHGARYWLFREGQYAEGDPVWYLHGYFA